MQISFYNKESSGVIVPGESQTVPDQSYSVKELIRRYQTGCMPPVCYTPVFDDDPDIDNPDPTMSPNFDLVDRQELFEFAQQTIKDAEQELKTVPPPETTKGASEEQTQ